MCAQNRAVSLAPAEEVRQLHDDDQWHQQVYEVAAQRISSILTDTAHYMRSRLRDRKGALTSCVG